MAEGEDLPPGSTIDSYVVEQKVAVGSFGHVYLGRGADGGAVAIKIAHEPSSALSTQQLVWQQNEIDLLTRLQHPSLVKVIGYGFLSDGRLYLLMEFAEGVLLRNYFEGAGRLEPIEAIRIARKIADALAYCHQSNVLHLDLKPDNIMICDSHEPRIKVLDFGLAQLADGWGRHQSDQPRGTVAYMAPECFDWSGSRATPHVDLYALGVILYELLTGRLPVTGSSMVEHVRKKRQFEFEPLSTAAPWVPEQLVGLVHSLLAVEPSSRLASAGAVAGQLKALYYATLQDGASPSTRSSPLFAIPVGIAHHAPFIGRTDEKDRLLGAFAKASGGAAQVLLISGDAGAGKSRLVGEVLGAPVVAQSAAIGFGRCRQLGDLVPYSSLREALGQLAFVLTRRRDGLQREAIAKEIPAAHASVLINLVSEFHDLVHSNGQPTESASLAPVGPERVHGAFCSFLTALARQRPVVVVLEDIHWADDGTLDVLSRIAQAGGPGGVCLLCTSRPSDRSPEGPELQRVELGPLTPTATASLLTALTGGASPELVAELIRAVPLLSTGNPFAATQIIRNLEAEGYLSRNAEGDVVLSDRLLRDYAPPDSVYSVVERNLRRLTQSALDVLAFASLIDRQFQPDSLARYGVFELAEIAGAIAIAEQEKVCFRTGDRWVFAHDTIRERLQHSVPPERAAALHARIAVELEREGCPSGTIGHHLERAGDLMKAAVAYLKAANEAEELHDPSDAINYLKRVIALLGDLPRADERDNLLARATHDLVRFSYLLGRVEDILSVVVRGESIVSMGMPQQRAALFGAYARVYYAQGNFVRAIEYSSACLEASSEDAALRRYRYVPSSIIGRAYCGSGKFGPAIPVLTTATDLAQEARDSIELSHSEGLLGVAFGYTGQFELGSKHIARSRSIAEQINDPVRVLASYFYEAALAEASDRPTEGVRHTTELLSYAEERGIGGLYLYIGTIFAGRHQFHLGQLGRARILLQNAIHFAALFGINLGVGWAHAFLGDVELVAGRHEEARTSYEKAVAIGDAGMKDEYAAPLGRIGLCHLSAVERRDLPEIQKAGDEAVERLRAVDNQSALTVALGRYVEALTLVGAANRTAGFERERANLLERLRISGRFWPEGQVDGVFARDAEAQHRFGPQDTLPSALFESLATIVEFVPEFAAKKAR